MSGVEGAWCLVSREYPPHSGGGIGTYADTFTRLLAARGIPVLVITAHANEYVEERHDNLEIIRMPLQADDSWSAPHPDIPYAPFMRQMWRQYGPHFVFGWQVGKLLDRLVERVNISVLEGCDTGAPLWTLLDGGLDIPLRDSVRIVTHVHSPSRWIEILNRRLEPSRTMRDMQVREMEQARWSDGVVVPSVGMQSWLSANWGVQAEVIRYPYPLSDTPPVGNGDVLFVGRLEYRKGIDTLLRAWTTVETDRTLRIVGSDVVDYRTGSRIGASLLAGVDRVEFMGPQPPERVKHLQAEASVIVVPSPDDNFPFTCIEAMAAGRIVVAANAGGAAEMIGHGTSGLLFDPYDANALANALTRALGMHNDERDAMGSAARRRIGDLCNPDRVIEQRLEHAMTARPLQPTEPLHASEPPIDLRDFAAATPAPPARPSLIRRVIRRLRAR